jgi:NTP pyrophosphatase (non-canonical NTP hydrolase)
MSLETFDHYQQAAARTAIYPGQGELTGLLYTTLGLAGEAGELANKVKKVLRDQEGRLTETRRAELLTELGDVLWYAAMLARELDQPLSLVAQDNLTRLASRQARGALHGEGDNR